MALVEKRSTLKVWGDVIFAIFLREIKSKSNDKLGVAWSVVSPVAFIFMLSYIRGRMDGGETHGVPTFYFMVFGMILVQFFSAVSVLCPAPSRRISHCMRFVRCSQSVPLLLLLVLSSSLSCL